MEESNHYKKLKLEQEKLKEEILFKEEELERE